MQLEEMKSMWKEMSHHVEKQNILTDKLIMHLTQERYNKRFNKLQIFESVGALICFAAAIFLFLNLERLDTWYLITFGVVTLLGLFLLPVVTLVKINRIKHLEISDGNYKDVLIKFHRRKKELMVTQKINTFLSIFLAIMILPVTSKIIKNRDLFSEEHIASLWIYISILLIFLFFVARWGLKGYRSVTSSAENILKELDK